MRNRVLFFLFLFLGFPYFVPAQQSNTTPPVLNDVQILGRRIFQQRCAVCHTQSTPGARRYGMALYKELVIGNEDAIQNFIRNGLPGKMPGFKYGLEAPEINALVEYLKTVSRPAREAPRTGGDAGPLD
jgi:mono/diheme cytochrome c family protein